MTFNRRLASLEKSMKHRDNEPTEVSHGPLFTLGHFEAEEDPEGPMAMLDFMAGRWREVDFDSWDVMKVLTSEQLEVIAQSGTPDLSGATDAELELIAEGHDPEKVLGTRL